VKSAKLLAQRRLTAACSRQAGLARSSARAVPSTEAFKGSVGLWGRGSEGLQLMRKSLGRHEGHPAFASALQQRKPPR
jgi:hypothetical protein